MAVVGGSHTSFDLGAFGAGAMTGAGVLAAALAQGVANLRAARQTDYLAWSAFQLRKALILSETFRLKDLEGYQQAVDTVAAQAAEIRTLRRELAVERARNKR